MIYKLKHIAIIDVENSTFSGGSLRGWKRLARDKNGVVQPGSSSGGKRSVDDCLEGVTDLVPTKRRCASVKSNETVEADAQSPAEPNELLSLELPWAWDPTCKERA